MCSNVEILCRRLGMELCKGCSVLRYYDLSAYESDKICRAFLVDSKRAEYDTAGCERFDIFHLLNGGETKIEISLRYDKNLAHLF